MKPILLSGLYLFLTTGFILASAAGPLKAQQHENGFPFIRNFSPSEYEDHDQNWSVTQDRRGVMYFGNTNGLMEYDGTAWRKIPVSNRSVVRSLATDQAGTVFIGAKAEFGFLAADISGRPVYRSLIPLVDSAFRSFSDVWKVLPTRQGVFFQTAKFLFRYKEGKITVWKSGKTFHNSFSAGGRLFIRETETGLLELTGDSLALLPGGGRFSEERIYGILQNDTNRFTILTRQSGFFRMDASGINPWVCEAGSELKSAQPYDLVRMGDGQMLIATLTQGLLIADSSGRISARINKENGLQDNVVFSVFPDRNGTIWTAMSKGISRIHWQSPVSFFQSGHGLDGQVVTLISQEKTVYAGTFSGLFRWETDRFKKIPEIGGIIIGLTASGQDVFASEPDRLFLIRKNKTRLIVKESFQCLKASSRFPDMIYAGLKDGCGILRKRNGSWVWEGKIPGLDREIRTIEESDRFIWFGSIFQGVSRLTLSEEALKTGTGLVHFGLESGLPELKDLEVTRDSKGIVFLTRKGIYRPEENSGKILPDPAYQALFQGDYRVFKFAESPAGAFCFYANDRVGIARRDTSGNLYWLFKPFKNWFPEDQVNVILPDGPEAFWLGSMRGLIHADARHPAPVPDSQTGVILRSITLAKDSVLVGGFGDPHLPAISYSGKELRFELAAPFYDQEQVVRYQYYLDGLEDGWSDWNNEPFKVYTSLPEGTYTFHVRAKNYQDWVTPETVLTFTVLPPWYRTWWMYGIYLGLLAAFIWILLKIQAEKSRQKSKEILDRQKEESRLKEAELRAEAAEAKERILSAQREAEQAELENARRISEINRQLTTALDELKSAQIQLVQTARMASLGQMTAGLAHEINNPLNFIRSGSEILRKDIQDLQTLLFEVKSLLAGNETLLEEFREIEKKTEADTLFPEIEEQLHAIEWGTERTAAIIRNLRKFTRLDEQVLKKADINESLLATADLFKHRLPEGIRLIVSPADTLPQVETYHADVNQILHALISNAAEAMTGGGVLTVSSGMDNGRVVLSVSDTGPGIPEENRKLIFEPFFTTRPVGTAQGLGLAICQSLAVRLKADLTFSSQSGGPTTFSLSLPLLFPAG